MGWDEFSIFWKSLVRIDVDSFLYIWLNSPVKMFGPDFSLCQVFWLLIQYICTTSSLSNHLLLDTLMDHSASLFLSFGVFNPFSCKKITDKVEFISVILLPVFYVSYVFYFSISSWLLYLVIYFLGYHFNSLVIFFTIFFFWVILLIVSPEDYNYHLNF